MIYIMSYVTVKDVSSLELKADDVIDRYLSRGFASKLVINDKIHPQERTPAIIRLMRDEPDLFKPFRKTFENAARG